MKSRDPSSKGGHCISSRNGDIPSLKTNSEFNHLKPWMVGILSRSLLGPGLFSGAFAVSFRECVLVLAFTVFLFLGGV